MWSRLRIINVTKKNSCCNYLCINSLLICAGKGAVWGNKCNDFDTRTKRNKQTKTATISQSEDVDYDGSHHNSASD